MIELTISNKIKLSGLDSNVASHIKKSLTLENPMYHKMKAMGKHVWHGMQYYKYWETEKETGDLLIPRGMSKRIQIFFDTMSLPYSVRDMSVKDKNSANFIRKIELRDYQIPLVEQAIKESEGIIHVGTGGGKTVLACELFYRTKLTGTVLVPNTVLLRQFESEFKKHYGYQPGIIGNGQKDIKEITIATVQGLSSDKNLLAALVSTTGMLIVDECQGFVTKQRAKVVGAFMPSKIFGLTATPSRSKDDGRSEAIKFFFGNVCAKHETTQLIPKIHVVPTDAEIREDEYPRMVEQMVAHEGRNKLIAGIVFGEALKDRKILVLTKRIEHYKNLQQIIGDREHFYFIDSEDKNRNNLLSEFKNGDRQYTAIFGTTSLLAVGLDIPSFDTLILACDMKSEVLTVQSVGRILRLFDGKPEPMIYDLWDNKSRQFSRQFRQRHEIYKSKNWEVFCKFELK